MGNKIVVRAYIQALEGVIDNLSIEQDGYGAVTGEPKYHIMSKSIARLIRTTTEEINYGDDKPFYGNSPRERLYWSFNGHGLDSPEAIRKELTDLIEAAKKNEAAQKTMIAPSKE